MRVGGQRLALRPGKKTGTHSIGGWVGPRVVLDGCPPRSDVRIRSRGGLFCRRFHGAEAFLPNWRWLCWSRSFAHIMIECSWLCPLSDAFPSETVPVHVSLYFRFLQVYLEGTVPTYPPIMGWSMESEETSAPLCVNCSVDFYARSQYCEERPLGLACLYVLLSARRNPAPTGQIWMKFDVCVFFENMSTKNQAWLQSKKYSRYCTWRLIYKLGSNGYVKTQLSYLLGWRHVSANVGHPQVTKIYNEEKLYSIRSLVVFNEISLSWGLSTVLIKLIISSIRINRITTRSRWKFRICTTTNALILYNFPHYIFLWPEDGPHWPKQVVVSIINKIQRCVLTYPTPS